MNFNVDEKGYYGEFGGAYIPEMLYPNVEELNYCRNRCWSAWGCNRYRLCTYGNGMYRLHGRN